MCLAIPAKVIEIKANHQAIIDVGGIHKTISLILVENVAVNNYVIVHAGFAISKLNESEATKRLMMYQAMLMDVS